MTEPWCPDAGNDKEILLISYPHDQHGEMGVVGTETSVTLFPAHYHRYRARLHSLGRAQNVRNYMTLTLTGTSG